MTNSARMPIFDGHNDTLQTYCREDGSPGRPLLTRTDEGHVDLPRAREGGLGGGLTAVFAMGEGMLSLMGDDEVDPVLYGDLYEQATLRAPELYYAQRVAAAQIAALRLLESEAKGALMMARTAGEVELCLREGVFAAVLHLEGAEPIDPQLESLPGYYDAGLRSLGIVWSRPNAFGHGVPFEFPSSPDTGPGLTDAGLALVKACNQMGILIDISHLNEKGFWDVAEASTAPVVATHSCVHALCPSARNLTDPQLDAIGQSGGIVGVNFHVAFLNPDGKEDVETPLAEIVRHVDYIAARLGIEHVALGSDFDGATMPRELGDVTGLPILVAALRAKGYSEEALRKVAHENWLRVFRQTWRDHA